MTARRGVVAAVACALALGATSAPPAAASTDVGLETAILAGSHVGSDNPIAVGGVVPGALLEVVQHVGRFALALEGIPRVTASTGTIGSFGRSSASLSLLNATANVELGAARRYRAGLGFQLVNLENVNGRNGDRNAVRITSPIYTVGTSVGLGRGALDVDVAVDPNLRGILHVANAAGVATTDKPEIGAEIDYRAAYRWTRGAVTYRAGVRGLSYHTRNARVGDLVDRNVGGGVTFDARVALGAR
ncbi:MAG: hypothetical protein NVS1B2_03500 [Vulcanimicrobiaceae bacterium]